MSTKSVRKVTKSPSKVTKSPSKVTKSVTKVKTTSSPRKKIVVRAKEKNVEAPRSTKIKEKQSLPKANAVLLTTKIQTAEGWRQEKMKAHLKKYAKK